MVIETCLFIESCTGYSGSELLIQKILVTDDGTEVSNRALKIASQISGAM